MRAIAAGDQSALWAFRDVANPPLRRRLRATLHRLDVPYGLEDLDGMVIDAVLAIAEVAGAWRPGGAPPWVWAHHRVVGVVHRWVGIFATSLDSLAQGDYGDALARLTSPGHAGAPSTGAEGTAFAPADVVSGGRAALQRLASDRPDAALLDAALSETVSPRDAALWLAVLDEREAGNRQPRGHGGRAFGMRPNAVRKAVTTGGPAPAGSDRGRPLRGAGIAARLRPGRAARRCLTPCPVARRPRPWPRRRRGARRSARRAARLASGA